MISVCQIISSSKLGWDSQVVIIPTINTMLPVFHKLATVNAKQAVEEKLNLAWKKRHMS